MSVTSSSLHALRGLHSRASPARKHFGHGRASLHLALASLQREHAEDVRLRMASLLALRIPEPQISRWSKLGTSFVRISREKSSSFGDSTLESE